MTFRDAGEQLIQGAMGGLYQAAVDIMYVSQVQCPVDTATLKASARILEPVRTPTSITVTLGYGYGAERNPRTGQLPSEYAVPVHERLEVKHAPPTKAKYLEDPMLAYASLFGPTIAMSITRAEKSSDGLKTSMEGLHVSPQVVAHVPGGDERRASLLAAAAGIGSARLADGAL